MSDIRTIVQSLLGSYDSLTLLKEGQNAAVYRVEVSDMIYIVRHGYETKQSGSSLEKVAYVQQQLLAAGYQHCALFCMYSAEHDVLIEEYVAGEQKKFWEYTNDELDAFIEALTSLHQLPVALFPDLAPYDSLGGDQSVRR